MAYVMLETLQLADQQINTITNASVLKIKSLNIPGYQSLEVSELNSYVCKAYQVQLRYLRDSNLEEWQKFCQATVMERSQQGIRYFSVIQSFEIMIEALGKFFREELGACQEIDGQPAPKVLEKLERRLQGLKMVTISTIMAAGLKDIRIG